MQMNEELIKKWKNSLALNLDDSDEHIETLEPVEDKGLVLERALLKRERRKFEVEKSIANERLQLEVETIKQERSHFERMRRQYEKQKRLDEEAFQAAKLEFEKYKELEKLKMQVETKEILNNCMNFKDFIDDFKGSN
jgi:hypothetical protein